MKKLFSTLLLLAFATAHANEQVAYSIYGQDDREEVVDARMKELSLSVVVALPSQFTWQLPLIKPRSVAQRHRVCSTDRFADQPSIGSCTGTHLGDGLIMTAAHCVSSKMDCEKFQWAFNYRTDVVGETSENFSMDTVYQCEKIVAVDKDRDVALVQLVKGAKKHAGMRLQLSAQVTDKVFAIGSPLGMPLKFSGMGQIFKIEDGFGQANLDAFHGNSGSPIMNSSRQLIGMLVAGGDDFVVTESGCRESLVFDETEHHEEILMLSTLPENFKQHIRRAARRLK